MDAKSIIAYANNEGTAEELFPEFVEAEPCQFITTVESVKPFFEDFMFTPWSTKRAEAVPVQRFTDAIGIIGPTESPLNINHRQGCRYSSQPFDYTVKWLNEFAQGRDSFVQRAMFVSLKPKSYVYAHIDWGLYYLIRDRYHVVLESHDGSDMYWGTDHEVWKEREVHWFNNKREHHSYNSGTTGRIHLIFDLLPKENMQYAELIEKVLLENATV